MLQPNKPTIADHPLREHTREHFRSAGYPVQHIIVLFAALTMLISIPIWTHPLPPLSDYVNHLARMHVIATLPKNPLLANFYEIDWQVVPNLTMDLVVPLLARVYPNGSADVNHFHQAGGMPFLIGTLLDAGLLHGDVRTVWGEGMAAYRRMPTLDESGKLVWNEVTGSSDLTVLRPANDPFRADGGVRVLKGNLGVSVIKVSSVPDDRMVIEAPALIFHEQ